MYTSAVYKVWSKAKKQSGELTVISGHQNADEPHGKKRRKKRASDVVPTPHHPAVVPAITQSRVAGSMALWPTRQFV